MGVIGGIGVDHHRAIELRTDAPYGPYGFDSITEIRARSDLRNWSWLKFPKDFGKNGG
jgi:hypothetical protein